jgi:hypothetical protein
MDMDDYDKECFDRIQRIAELEAENSRLLAERARFCTERNWECNEKLAAVERIAKLEAENAFLRTQWQEGGYGMFTKVDKERLTEENQRLEAEVERLTVDGIHTCHDHCQRPMCVLRRENEELRKRLEEMSDEHRNN